MAKKKAKKKQDLLMLLLDAAERHGAESEPEHEVGDLQQLVMVCWSHLTKEQQQQAAEIALTDLGFSQWMKPEKVNLGGGVMVGRF